MPGVEKQSIQIIFSEELKAYRRVNRISQIRMAKLLHMSERSYISLEHGQNGPSAVTLLLYMLQLDEHEVIVLLNKLLEKQALRL